MSTQRSTRRRGVRAEVPVTQEAIVEASHAFSRHLLDMAFLVASEAQR